MSDVQIFISYARDDNLLPPGDGNCGFVDYLHKELVYEFTRSGPQRPALWRDTRNILDAEPFDRKIERALDTSQILVVVLSPNWLASKYCAKELRRFAQSWYDRGEDADQVRHRIVIVGKRNVDRDRLPSQLQGQVGVNFYSLEDDRVPLKEYFRGKVVDERYQDQMDQLVSALLLFSARFGGWRETSRPILVPNGHTIFVAKPANDMRLQYQRIVKELVGRGYTVVPDPNHDVPNEKSVVSFIDHALAQAEASVHLLGEGDGFAPEGQDKRIVPLQLQRAAIRVSALPPSADIPGREFERIVWAPRTIEGGLDSGDAASGRDPLKVLERFHQQLPNDKVEGDAISKFVDYLVQHLAERAAPAQGSSDSVADESKPGMRVYVHHSPEDTDYAFELRDLLAKRDVVPVLPVLDANSPAELTDYHRKALARCDAVLLCWAGAREMWARSQASELGNWHTLGRSNKFKYRGVVAGPPAGGRKKYAKKVFPPDEIDIVLDLTELSHPTPEALDPLFSPPK